MQEHKKGEDVCRACKEVSRRKYVVKLIEAISKHSSNKKQVNKLIWSIFQVSVL